MKPIKKGSEPSTLGDYRVRFRDRPTPPKWKEFNKSSQRSTPVKTQLWQDQGGICAYCEIGLLPNDQTVEHFIPAHRTTRTDDWDLRWDNLLLTCKGGSDAALLEEGEYRYSLPPNNEECCGFHKRGSCDSLLCPLHIEPSIPLFKVGLTTGIIFADEDVCQDVPIDPTFVEHTIRALNLNCFRLKKNRLAIINSLLEESEFYEDPEIARTYLVRNSEGCWPSFFTTYRSFLGPTAEVHLATLDYYP